MPTLPQKNADKIANHNTNTSLTRPANPPAPPPETSQPTCTWMTSLLAVSTTASPPGTQTTSPENARKPAHPLSLQITALDCVYRSVPRVQITMVSTWSVTSPVRPTPPPSSPRTILEPACQFVQTTALQIATPGVA